METMLQNCQNFVQEYTEQTEAGIPAQPAAAVKNQSAANIRGRLFSVNCLS
jgi:hypothetical protein